MKLYINKQERIHSLDALRAVMMMLGIVLHATEPYSLGDDPFWPKDPNGGHVSLNYIFSIIHIFRMPVFFLIAGFFGALLFYDRGAKAMIQNRLKRLVLPFVVFLFLLHPVVVLAFKNTSEIFNDPISPLVSTLTTIPQITYHLWFLYYLIFISAFTFGLATMLKKAPGITRRITAAFEWLMRKRAVFVIIFSILIFLLLVWMWDLWVPTRVSFTPDGQVMIFYGLFYLLGWTLYKSKHMLSAFMRFDWGYMSLAVIIFTLKFIFRSAIDDVLFGALNAIVVWFFVFGFMGLFIRYASKHSPRMRYISDASYWVYLVHLPLTGFIPGLIVDLPLPVFGKFLIAMLLTTLICFTSYHFLVRNTVIGKFLNGRRYPLRLKSA